MATINDESAINYTNTSTRPSADTVCQLYNKLKDDQAKWNARSLGSILAAGSGQVLDGSPNDGRPQITGDQAYAVAVQRDALITYLEANNKAILNVFMAVAVNTLPRV